MANISQMKKDLRRRRAWVTARKVTQYLMLALFLLLFLLARRDGGWSGEVSNLPFRLDPLTMVANRLAGSAVAGAGLAIIVLLLTLVFGRAWCGWICPLGTVLDLVPLRRGRGKRRPPAEGWRMVKSILLAATLTAALMGSLTLLVFDPLTLFYRTLTTALLPALDRGVVWLEGALFRVPFLSEPVAAFDTFIRPALLPVTPDHFRDGLLFGLLFAGVVSLNLVAERFWCRYLCPLGAMLGWLSKIALFRRVPGDTCTACSVCPERCPTGTIDAQKGYVSDPSECTMCLDCLATCSHSRVVFSLKPAAWQAYDPGRREFLNTIALSAAAVVLTRSGALAKREPPFLVRPPGVREANEDVLAVTRCIRCSACMRTCPTNAIQPGVLDAGLQGFGAPLIVARLGYCDFACNACGQVCPSGAIPALSLEQKRLTVIGKAYIDEHRCLPWADGTECFVCEEMCPLPEKAIVLQEAEPGGVRAPVVQRDLCIGCGICEYKCPVNGEAAIRVYVPDAAVA